MLIFITWSRGNQIVFRWVLWKWQIWKFLTKTKLGLSQPLHDCNDTNQADHVPESNFLGNNLGKVPKYQPPGNRHTSERSNWAKIRTRVRVGFGKNWHFEKKFRQWNQSWQANQQRNIHYLQCGQIMLIENKIIFCCYHQNK